jgi:hypothetical protein
MPLDAPVIHTTLPLIVSIKIDAAFIEMAE